MLLRSVMEKSVTAEVTILMKPTKAHVSKSSTAKVAAKPAGKAVNEPPVEVDRRGKPLPPRQRVGGIITPQ